LLESEFARVRPLLDRAFATIDVEDVFAESIERSALLGLGAEIVAGFTEAKLRATIAPDRVCYRMWRSDANGTQNSFWLRTGSCA
jgi:hypothetical protein